MHLGKLDTFIDYPISELDLTSYIISDNQKLTNPPIYDLYAISIHSGGLGGGHYTAYGLNPMDKQWYSFNDSSVSKVGNINSIKTSGAYLLFYQRRPPPST